MTENKRFVNKGKDIFQYGEWWCSANGEHCADVIVTAINEFIEENEQFKYTLGAYKVDLNNHKYKCSALEEENKKLKVTIAQLIEQKSENNKLLLSDIRILENALWCPNCTNDIKRLKELRKEFLE